jgi:hypothetical protein
MGNVARMGVVRNAYGILENTNFKPKKKVEGGGGALLRLCLENRRYIELAHD